jgi:cell division protein FtsB
MSDPRLTAAQVRAFRDDADGIRDDYESRQLSGLHSRCSELSVVETIELCDSHEALRADVERLTAEHAALKTSDSQRVILEMLLSAIDTVLLGNEVSDFEESFPPVRQVIDLKDERDHLRAENAALREEIARLNTSPVTAASVSTGDSLPQQIASTLGLMHSGPVVGDNGALLLTAERDALREERDALKSGIARLHSLGKVAGVEQQIRTAHAAGVQQGREQGREEILSYLKRAGWNVKSIRNVRAKSALPAPPAAETKEPR